MDEQLAAIYGTGQDFHEEDDLEKTAAAELLVKLAEEEGVDLNQFSDEDVEGMINELYGEGIEHTAEAETEEDIDEESQEKFAEADFLGRVMAHSMVQELNNIEKEAADAPMQGPKERLRSKIPRKMGRAARAAGGATGVSQMIEGLKDIRKAKGQQSAEVAAGHAKRSLQAFPTGKGGVAALKGGAKRFGKRVGIPLALAGGAALAYKGLKGRKKKEKNASALEKLAETRAYEMLMEAGYLEVPEGYEQEKLAGQLGYEVDNLALQMLEAAGYPVEWNE